MQVMTLGTTHGMHRSSSPRCTPRDPREGNPRNTARHPNCHCTINGPWELNRNHMISRIPNGPWELSSHRMDWGLSRHNMGNYTLRHRSRDQARPTQLTPRTSPTLKPSSVGMS